MIQNIIQLSQQMIISLGEYLEIKRVRKFKRNCKKVKNNLEKWIKFILNEDIEEIKSMDNKNITDAENKLELLNSDEKEKAIAELLAFSIYL